MRFAPFFFFFFEFQPESAVLADTADLGWFKLDSAQIGPSRSRVSVSRLKKIKSHVAWRGRMREQWRPSRVAASRRIGRECDTSSATSVLQSLKPFHRGDCSQTAWANQHSNFSLQKICNLKKKKAPDHITLWQIQFLLYSCRTIHI